MLLDNIKPAIVGVIFNVLLKKWSRLSRNVLSRLKLEAMADGEGRWCPHVKLAALKKTRHSVAAMSLTEPDTRNPTPD